MTNYLLLLVILLAAFLVLWYENWKPNLVGLGIIFAAVAVHLFLGGMIFGAVTILFTAFLSLSLIGFIAEKAGTYTDSDFVTNGKKFQLIFAFIVLGFDYVLAISLSEILGLDPVVLLAGLALMSNGILEFSMSNRSTTIIIGLFMMLGGFYLIYLNINFSLLVAALMGAILLGLGGVGAYWASQNRGDVI